MDSFFPEIGTCTLDVVQISTGFILTMLIFFGVKDKRHFWLNYFLLLTFAVQCVFIALFHDGLTVKLFAALMLISTLTVEVVVTTRRKLEKRAL